jgi:hypothetical protein
VGPAVPLVVEAEAVVKPPAGTWRPGWYGQEQHFLPAGAEWSDAICGVLVRNIGPPKPELEQCKDCLGRIEEGEKR